MSNFDVRNENSEFTGHNAIDPKIAHGYSQVQSGIVKDVRRDNYIRGQYDVMLQGMDGLVVRGCRLLSPDRSGGAVGVIKPLREGQPVVVAFRGGSLQEGYIIGAFSTEGRADEYYSGEMVPEHEQLTETPYGKVPYNRVSIHPSMVAQEDASFEGFGGKNFRSPWASVEYAGDGQDAMDARPVMAAMKLVTSGGDTANYSHGADVTYAGNIVQVAIGSTETVPTKLTRFATEHLQRAISFSGVDYNPPDVTAATEEIVKTYADKVKKLVQTNDVGGRIFQETLNSNLLALDELQLALGFLKAAQEYSRYLATLAIGASQSTPSSSGAPTSTADASAPLTGATPKQNDVASYEVKDKTPPKSIAIFAGHNDVPEGGGETGTNGTQGDMNGQTAESYFNDQVGRRVAELAPQYGLNVKYYTSVKTTSGSDPQSNWERARTLEAQGVYSLEMHFNAPGNTGSGAGTSGVIPGFGGKGIHQLDENLGKEFGRFSPNFRDGLGAPTRGLTILELAPMSGGVETGLRNEGSRQKYIDEFAHRVLRSLKGGDPAPAAQPAKPAEPLKVSALSKSSQGILASNPGRPGLFDDLVAAADTLNSGGSMPNMGSRYHAVLSDIVAQTYPGKRLNISSDSITLGVV